LNQLRKADEAIQLKAREKVYNLVIFGVPMIIANAFLSVTGHSLNDRGISVIHYLLCSERNFTVFGFYVLKKMTRIPSRLFIRGSLRC
jgi:hypothetical protein